MVALPIHDRVGNSLIDLRDVTEAELTRIEKQASLPASLVVVVYADVVLLVFDSWRKQWELPGGMREGNETAHQAALRELREETGISSVELTLAAVAEFDLVKPPRREHLAIYRVRLQSLPPLTVNDEVLAFRWWPPTEPVTDAMSPLDAEIARHVFSATDN